MIGTTMEALAVVLIIFGVALVLNTAALLVHLNRPHGDDNDA